MAASKKLKELVGRMPEADRRGMLTEGIDKAKIEKVIAEIRQGGRTFAEELIGMLAEPGSEENVKPHYALHCLVNHTLVSKDEPGRKELCEVMAEALSKDYPTSIKAYLCQELGWAGGQECLAALGALLTDDALSSVAAMALVGIQKGAVTQLRAAWPKAKGASRRPIIDGLAALAEKSVLPLLRAALQDDDQEVRQAAAAGVAKLGDPNSVDSLLSVVEKGKGWERFQAAKSCLVMAESLAEAGKTEDAKSMYARLKKVCEGESLAHLRHAVDLGLERLPSK